MKSSAAIPLLAVAGCLSAAGAQPYEAARKAEAQACLPCHSLRIIHVQRLSPAAWGKELDKMAGWGAVIPKRQLLLDYLSEEYSDKKPLPEPELSADGDKKRP